MKKQIIRKNINTNTNTPKNIKIWNKYTCTQAHSMAERENKTNTKKTIKQPHTLI